MAGGAVSFCAGAVVAVAAACVDVCVGAVDATVICAGAVVAAAVCAGTGVWVGTLGAGAALFPPEHETASNINRSIKVVSSFRETIRNPSQ